MTMKLGVRDLVFAVNRTQHVRGMGRTVVDRTNSTVDTLGHYWNNIFNGYPAQTGGVPDNLLGWEDGVQLWIDMQANGTYMRDLLDLNAIGMVNLSWGMKYDAQDADGTDIRVQIRTTNIYGEAGANNFFNPGGGDGDVIGMESSNGNTWLLEMTDEHTPPATNPERFFRFDFDSMAALGDLKWLLLGELFLGSIFKPACPAVLRIRKRAGVQLLQGPHGYTWERRTRGSMREVLLGWQDLTETEYRELEQFFGNAGDSFTPAARGGGAAGVLTGPGMVDFGSPIMMSPPREAFDDDVPTWRNAIYCVVDPGSFDFQWSYPGWTGTMRLLEVT